MFFVGIFGIQQKEKKLWNLDDLDCKCCKIKGSPYLVKKYSYFHIFFIPLIKWNEEYYIICEGCNHIYMISKEKGKRVEAGEKDIITYWDLKEVENPHGEIKCPLCQGRIEENFEFCPYCGSKLK